MSLFRPAVPASSLVVGNAGDHAVPAVRVPVAGATVTDPIAPDAPDRVVRWVEGTAHCPVCPWAASMTGDSVADVVAFLNARWREHADWRHDHTERHPEALTHE
jgi:hypothetical protein